MQILTENRKALFNYQILEKYNAGIVLTGQEVKSVKQGRMNLDGSFVIARGNEIFLLGAKIPAYQPNNLTEEYNPQRTRKLLLKKDEIKEIIGKSHQKGLTMVPLLVYNAQGRVKIEFGLAKGKRKIDKREKIKRRETDREINRAMKKF